MRKIVFISALALGIWAKSAYAGTATISIQATPMSGPAPLAVTFTASGETIAYHWDFGDGAVADGTTVVHTYETAGHYTAIVTGTSFAGGASGQASIDITAYALSLKAQSPVRAGRPGAFQGALA